jgi:cytochrome P450
MPTSSLADIFDVSVARARTCTKIIGEMSLENGTVDMNEFFLHEAQAQLQMALFGLPEKFMDATNKPLRDAFAGRNPDPNYIRQFCGELLGKIVELGDEFAGPNEGKPAKGPLSKVIFEAANESAETKFGNALIFAFAGHDTTGHTMTW